MNWSYLVINFLVLLASMALEFDPVKTELLKLKFGSNCHKLSREQMGCVLDLCKLLRPDYNFPCVESLERWANGSVSSLYDTVDIDGQDFTYIKPSSLAQLYWANPLLREKLKVYPSYLKTDNQTSGLRYRERYVAPYHQGLYYGDICLYSDGSCLILGFVLTARGVEAKLSLIYTDSRGVWVKSNPENSDFLVIFDQFNHIGQKLYQSDLEKARGRKLGERFWNELPSEWTDDTEKKWSDLQSYNKKRIEFETRVADQPPVRPAWLANFIGHTHSDNNSIVQNDQMVAVQTNVATNSNNNNGNVPVDANNGNTA